MKQQSLSYAAYNLWANARLVHLFKSVAPALLHREIISSFPSIHLTLLHLWAVEEIWLQRMQGKTPTQFLSSTFEGSTEDVFVGLLDKSQEVLDFLAAQDDKYFETPITFSLLTAAGSFTHTPAEMAQHLFNHQTSHRGQLITMGRQLGIKDFPRTDYIIWARERH